MPFDLILIPVFCQPLFLARLSDITNQRQCDGCIVFGAQKTPSPELLQSIAMEAI